MAMRDYRIGALLVAACTTAIAVDAVFADDDDKTYTTGTKTEMIDHEAIIADWPAKPKEAATALVAKYGPPDEATPSMLIWKDNGPWKKTMVSREEIQHDWPKPHTDFILQAIDYRVPPDKFDDLAQFDGSVVAERTKGTLAARCGKEEMNFLALNLAHEIVTEAKTVDEARAAYVDAAMKTEKAMKAKKPDRKKLPAFVQKLQFEISETETGDPDMAITPAPPKATK